MILHKKYFILIIVLLSYSNMASSQFLKNIKKSVQVGLQKASLSIVEVQSTSEANKVIDSTSNRTSPYFNSNASKSVIHSSTLPDSYNYEWKYTMQIETDNSTLSIDYFLKPDANNFGIKLNMKKSKSVSNIFMVMDLERKTSIVFMDMHGNKIATPTSLPDNLEIDKSESSDDFTFDKLGVKNILGYKCQGYRMESKDAIVKFYATNDANVSFNQLFSSYSRSTPKGFDPSWLNNIEESLIMEIEFQSKDKKHTNAKIKCIALKKESFSIRKQDYQFME